MAGPDPNQPPRATDSEALQRECAAIEELIAELRVRYEQYFLGIDRKMPALLHNALKKRLQGLQILASRGSAPVKFRVAGLRQKLATYERLWERTVQEIENGIYRKDLFKARMHAKSRGTSATPATPVAAAPVVPPLPAAAQAVVFASSVPLAPSRTAPAQAVAASAVPLSPPAPPVDAASVAARAPVTIPKLTAASFPPGKPGTAPPSVAAAGPLRPQGVSGSGEPLPDAKVRAIYDAYVTAKRRCNEDTSRLTLEAVASSLRKQMPDLLKKHSRGVEFKVVIKDGKAVLRAVPRES